MDLQKRLKITYGELGALKIAVSSTSAKDEKAAPIYKVTIPSFHGTISDNLINNIVTHSGHSADEILKLVKEATDIHDVWDKSHNSARTTKTARPSVLVVAAP